MARPQKPYQTSWGEIVAGLARGDDRRWRIIQTGERFREEDERKAIARFRARTGDPGINVVLSNHASAEDYFIDGPAASSPDPVRFTDDGGISVYRNMPSAAMWEWMRNELLTRPDVA